MPSTVLDVEIGKQLRRIAFLFTVFFHVSCAVDTSQKMIPVTGVTMSQEFLDMEVGEQEILAVSVLPPDASNKDVVFSSSRESVATITPDGIVEALSIGETIISVTTLDGKFRAYTRVCVHNPIVHVSGISLNVLSLSMTEGESISLFPEFTPANVSNTEVVWSSDDESVATVSNDGVVTANKHGTVLITVTSLDGGKSATCQVEVLNAYSIVTGEVSHISCRNAVISGHANIPQTTSMDLMFGVLLSTSSGVLLGTAKQIEARSFDQNFNFSVCTGILEPETTYYYRSFIAQAGEIMYGEVRSFKTLDVDSMVQSVDATEVSHMSAFLNANINLMDCTYDLIECGFEVIHDGETLKYSVPISSEDGFSLKLNDLENNSYYSYRAYICLDGIFYWGDFVSFVTQSISAVIVVERVTTSYQTASICCSLEILSKGEFSKSVCMYYDGGSNSTAETLISKGNKILSQSYNELFNFSLNLRHSCEYSYVIVATVDNVEIVSEVGHFKTKEINVSFESEVQSVSCLGARITGRVSVEPNLGFYDVFLYCNGQTYFINLDTDGTFVLNIGSLKPDTEYFYTIDAYVHHIQTKFYSSKYWRLKTSSIVGSVSAEIVDASYRKASIAGGIRFESDENFSTSATLYYSTSAENTIESLIANGIKTSLKLDSMRNFSLEISPLIPGEKYYYAIVADVDNSIKLTFVGSFFTPAILIPEGAVDLGLSVLWATSNLGAISPEDSGSYFQWAGLEDVSENSIFLDLSYCPYYNGSGWTKYVVSSYYEDWSGTGDPDGKRVLDPEDDVAHVKLGGDWRMPTEKEWGELNDAKNCTWVLTSQNNVKGYKITSKLYECKGNSIFLPFAGYRREDKLIFGSTNSKDDLEYWCSTVQSPSSAYSMPQRRLRRRYIGLPVRPVAEY